MQRQQIAQRVIGQMNFRSLFTPDHVVAGPGAAGWSRSKRPTVQSGSRKMQRPSTDQTQQHAEVVHDCIKTGGLEPALRLLMHAQPGWQVVRQHPPSPARGH